MKMLRYRLNIGFLNKKMEFMHLPLLAMLNLWSFSGNAKVAIIEVKFFEYPTAPADTSALFNLLFGFPFRAEKSTV